MNVFELARLVTPVALGALTFYFVAPFGTILAIFVALGVAICGFLIGPLLGWLLLLPFEGAARLGRFLKTGRWTDGL